MFEPFIAEQIQASLQVKQAMAANPTIVQKLQQACACLVSGYQQGRKTLLIGNGGSAADAQHIAAELVGRFYTDRPSLAAIALTTDTSILTAVGNDYGYARLFARQIEALGQPDDILIALSTSGNSDNILQGIQQARTQQLKVIGLTGATGGAMVEHCDICLCVPSTDTPRIQECHILIGHILCAAIENTLFGSD